MVKLSDIDLPMVFENRLLFSHGVHNSWHIHPVEVEKSMNITDWSDQKNKALFLSHSERDAQKWVGRIENPYIKNGELYGDLEIHDADLAMKLGPGKAPLGVSAEIRWPKEYMDPTNFSYTGFAVVPNPEVRETQVNFSEDIKEKDGFRVAKIDSEFRVDTVNFSKECGDKEKEFAKVTGMESKRKELGMSPSEFYAVPRDPPSDSALPIFDEAHVRNALARLNQTKLTSEEKTKAKNKIKAAAKKFDIEVSAKFSEDKEEVAEEDKESNLMSAERRLEKQKMENTTNEVVPEVKEDITNESEEVKNETVEETKVEETVESDESEAKFSALEAKFDALAAEIESLKNNFAKFSEEKEEDNKEEEEVEGTTDEKSEEEVEEKTVEVEESTDDAEKAEEVAEEGKEDAVEEVETSDDTTAEFSELTAKIGKLVDVMEKKEAKSMTTAEFGTSGKDKGDDVIDRLTNFLEK